MISLAAVENVCRAVLVGWTGIYSPYVAWDSPTKEGLLRYHTARSCYASRSRCKVDHFD